jgi:hypothetical protein
VVFFHDLENALVLLERSILQSVRDPHHHSLIVKLFHCFLVGLSQDKALNLAIRFKMLDERICPRYESWVLDLLFWLAGGFGLLHMLIS